MKRFTLLKTMLLLCALIVGSGSAWGTTDGNTTISLSSSALSFTNGSWGTGSPSSYPESATQGDLIASDGNAYVWTYTQSSVSNTKMQLKAKEGIVVSPIITSSNGFTITITYTFSSDDGASASIQIGSETAQTSSSPGTLSAETSSTSEYVTIKSPGKRALYITQITITPKAGGGAPTAVSKPYFTPIGGTYTTAQSVSINCGTDGATIHFTTDGNDPTTSSPTYSTALSVTSTTTIKALAVKDGLENSAIATATYNIVYPEASLPFAFNGGRDDIANTSGLTHSGLGSDYNASTNPNTQLKFDGANDELVLRINENPGKLTFSVKGNGSGDNPWSGTFKVQESTDGSIYTDVASYSDLGSETSKTITAFKSTTRYIKWVYTTKTTGNVGLGNINLTKAELVSITDAGYATYVSDNDLDYEGVTGLKAYQATLSGSKITFTKVTTVPAGEGVLLQGEEGDYNVPVTTGVAAWDADDNAFVRGTGAAVPTSDGGNHNYILSGGAAGIGFYQADDKTVDTNRAYLQTTTSGARIGLNFDDETTGISAVENVEPSTSKTVVFNLNGQRIANPSKGLYIVNGKKVIIK